MRRVVDTWVNRPMVDYPLVALAVVAGFWLFPASTPSMGQLPAWYQALASVSGVLFGFGAIALTIVFSVAPSERLRSVYESTGPRLYHLVVSCLGGLAATTAGFLLLFMVPEDDESVRNAITVGLVVFAASRFLRLWWLFTRVLRALISTTASTNGSADDIDIWERPEVLPSDYALKRAGRTTS